MLLDYLSKNTGLVGFLFLEIIELCRFKVRWLQLAIANINNANDKLEHNTSFNSSVGFNLTYL